MTRRLNKSWEKTYLDEVHSPEGVEELRKAVRFGLQKKYKGLAETMWRYEFGEGFEDMQVMSQDTVPEVFLMKNGQCVWFRDDSTGQMHCLPLVMNGGVNMYGKMVSWSPVPIGWNDTLRGASPTMTRIRDMKLNAENSVVMRNDLFGGNDEDYIDAMISELVDNTLTMNQLQLIAKAPFVFNVTEDNMISAKNFFLAMSTDRPAIFTNALGEKPMPVLESTQMKIDPALFELFDRFECQILEYIGFPCVPITKRAQQSVSEVTENDDKIRVRRMEKLKQREKACERIKEIFGVDISVVSVIDEELEKEREQNGADVATPADRDSAAQRDRSLLRTVRVRSAGRARGLHACHREDGPADHEVQRALRVQDAQLWDTGEVADTLAEQVR